MCVFQSLASQAFSHLHFVIFGETLTVNALSQMQVSSALWYEECSASFPSIDDISFKVWGKCIFATWNLR